MNELRPLRSASNQAISRVLLESAAEDHSPPGASERALHALNLGAIAAATAVTVHAAGSSSVGSHVAGALVLKWLGLGLVAGAVTLVSAERVMQALSESPTTPAALPRQLEIPVARQTKRIPAPTDAPSASEGTPLAAKLPQRHVDALELRAAEPAEPSVRALEPSPPAAEPLQELRTIRRALADHAPARALSLLDAFVARHPASSLLEEAAVLRFDALLASSSSEARAQGQDFVRRYPHSAYAERVRVKLSELR